MTYRLETLAIHAGQETPDPATNARAVPIHQTVAYVFDDTQHAADLFSLKQPGNIYSRITNPTQATFEERVNALEGGIGALATASGAAAVTYSILNLCTAGDNIVAMSSLYGGTFALLAHTLPQYGITAKFIDPEHPEKLGEYVDENTRAVFGETIANPANNVLDVRAWADAAHAHGLPLIIDNTVPTPMGCRVFDLGADIAVHSATKFMGGHGTIMGGVIVDSGKFDWLANSERFPNMTGPDGAYHQTVWTDAAGPAAYITRARTVLMRNTGAVITPMNAWMFLQGLESLHVRLERHFENSLAIAEFLEQHPKVSWVNYPGLKSSPWHETANKTLSGRGYGALVSFGLKAGFEAGPKFVESLKLFSLLVNIGDAKSSVTHSASTTHSQLTESQLKQAGVPPEMIRLSIGIENVDDLIEDLDQALANT